MSQRIKELRGQSNSMQQPYITLLYAKEKTVQAVPTKVSKKAKTSLIFTRKTPNKHAPQTSLTSKTRSVQVAFRLNLYKLYLQLEPFLPATRYDFENQRSSATKPTRFGPVTHR